MTLDAPIQLHTDRLVLRDFTADDLDGMQAITGDPEVTKWLSFDTRTRESTADMLDGILSRQQEHPRSDYYFAITLETEGSDLIGFVRLGLGGVKAADLGYTVATAYQRQGYAGESATAMIDFAFDKLGLHRLTANIGPVNTASIRLIQSLGFSYEGTIRDHVFTNGAWRDSRSYSLLSHEWASAPRCEYCNRRIPPRTTGGRTPKFCSTAHRQAAYRARQRDD